MTDAAALAIVGERRGTMYDPVVVDACFALDPQIRRAEPAETGHADVLQQLLAFEAPVDDTTTDGHRGAASPPVLAMDADVTALIRRVEGTPEGAALTDVLALSSHLVQRIAPEATGAWFLPDAEGGQLEATAPFGCAAALLVGRSRRQLRAAEDRAVVENQLHD